jgi:uncharacterized membrane protein
MKDKILFIISMTVLIITLVVFIINYGAHPFTDWVVRLNGVIMLLSIAVVSFSTVRLKRTANKG